MVVLTALLAVAMFGVLPAARAQTEGSADAQNEPALLGFATGSDWRDDLPMFAAEAGKYPAFHQVFRTIDADWTPKWLPDFFDDPHDWGMVSWLVTHVDDLDAFNRGDYDSDLQAMVEFFAGWASDDPEKRLVVAPFPEANLLGHPWSGDPTGFRAAFERIRDAFRQAGLGPDQVRFVFVMNGISSSGYSYDQFYPGDDVVDIISFNKHNRNIELNSDDLWRDYGETFGVHIDEMQRTISRTKPIFINQTGSVDDEQGRRGEWLRDMFEGLKAEDQVIGAVYFDRLKTENGIESDFRVLSEEGDLPEEFVNGYATWSSPSEAAWIFDGRMDAWVGNREQALATGFRDVPTTHIFADSIRWLADTGISRGCNPPENDLFCPEADLTRGQMAAMLARAFTLSPTERDYFVDDSESIFEDDVNRLAEAGITKGCNPPVNDRFCPDAELSRAQMAAFLVRAFGYGDTGSTDPFVDDDESVFERDIERLRAAGVTAGCNPPDNDRFCPDDPITRGQMAAFLDRAYD